MPYRRASTAIAAPLPRCPRRSADAATALPPLTPCCRCRLRAARFRRAASAEAATMLPTLPPRCRRRCCAAATATVLPPPARCIRHSANAATVLPPPPPRCHHRCRSAAAVAVLLPPPPLCRRRCCRPAAPLPATAAANTVAALPPPPSRCQCHHCTVHHRHAAAALPTLPPRCQRCRRTFAAVAVLPPPPPLYRRRCCRPVALHPRCSPPLRCRRCRHRRCRHCRCCELDIEPKTVDRADPDRWVLFPFLFQSNNEWDVNREKTNVWTSRNGLEK
jgi:hypothetical protein